MVSANTLRYNEKGKRRLTELLTEQWKRSLRCFLLLLKVGWVSWFTIWWDRTFLHLFCYNRQVICASQTHSTVRGKSNLCDCQRSKHMRNSYPELQRQLLHILILFSFMRQRNVFLEILIQLNDNRLRFYTLVSISTAILVSQRAAIMGYAKPFRVSFCFNSLFSFVISLLQIHFQLWTCYNECRHLSWMLKINEIVMCKWSVSGCLMSKSCCYHSCLFVSVSVSVT